jgi:two-component system, LytTR family, response regulator
MMKKYKCYIVDDEPLAINVIENHLAKLDQFEICGTTTDPIVAFNQLKTLQPDLLFLDIEMPDLSGLELIESIESKPDIIITTAYREYAVEGFEHNVLDYLVKPIPFKRFLKAADKFLQQRQTTGQNAIETTAYLFVKADRKTIKIDFESILYIEGLKDYSRIVLADQKIMTKVSIGNIFELLPPKQFLRVHKSFIVSKNKITAYTAHDIEINEIEIPIGRVYKVSFLKGVISD